MCQSGQYLARLGTGSLQIATDATPFRACAYLNLITLYAQARYNVKGYEKTLNKCNQRNITISTNTSKNNGEQRTHRRRIHKYSKQMQSNKQHHKYKHK